MNLKTLHKVIDELPLSLQELVALYVTGLQRQHQIGSAGTDLTKAEITANRQAGVGELRGKVWMADDFNAPLADFTEY